MKNLIENTVIKKYIIYIIIIISTIIFAGCNSDKKLEDLETEIKEIEYTNALIEKNNNIYIYNYNDEYLDPIGDLTRLKELATLSDDYKNIAFKYVDDENKINIYNLETNEYRELNINIDNQKEISDIQIENGMLVLALYNSPSSNEYLIYDLENLQLLNTCEGILIEILDNGKTLIYGNEINGITSIFINDKKVYTLEQEGEILLDGIISSDKKTIGFLTFLFDKETFEQKEYIYICNIEDNSFKDIEIIEKPFDISGEIYLEDNEIIITDMDKFVEFNNGEFIIKDINDVNVSIGINSKRLKGILKETFESEDIDESLSWQQLGVNSIIWFKR